MRRILAGLAKALAACAVVIIIGAPMADNGARVANASPVAHDYHVVLSHDQGTAHDYH